MSWKALLQERNLETPEGSSNHLLCFSSPLQTLLCGHFTRWIHEIRPKNLGNIPKAQWRSGDRNYPSLPQSQLTVCRCFLPLVAVCYFPTDMFVFQALHCHFLYKFNDDITMRIFFSLLWCWDQRQLQQGTRLDLWVTPCWCIKLPVGYMSFLFLGSAWTCNWTFGFRSMKSVCRLMIFGI